MDFSFLTMSPTPEADDADVRVGVMTGPVAGHAL